MEIEEAITEFVNMLRLGTAALREIISQDSSCTSDLESDFNQLLYLVDGIDEVSDNIRSKTQAARRGTAGA